MTEQEYLDATNLAKLRAAHSILTDCLFIKRHEDEEFRRICESVHRQIMNLQMKISIID